MPDHVPVLRRYLAPLLATAVVLATAVGLCLFGSAAIAANYDGFISWFQPLAAASCCGSVVLVVFVSVAWLLFLDSRLRRQQDTRDR